MELKAAVSVAVLLAAPFLIAQKTDQDKDDVQGRAPALARRPGGPRGPSAAAAQQPIPTPTGFSITPTAAPGSVFTSMNPNLPGLPNYIAGQPMTTAVSPDGKTLLVLTSGYNLLNDANGKNLASAGNEYVFVYDISTDKLVQLGAVPIPAAYAGLAWNPNGKEFYISGGAGDLVLVVTAGTGGFALGGTVSMGHPNPTGLGSGNGLGMPSIVAGMAVNASGNRLLVANMLNDSVTLVDIPNRKKLTELDLRPGVIDPSKAGTAGGEYPFWVAIKGDAKAYVSSLRDREIVVLSLAGDQPTVTARIPVQGNPNKMILDKSQSRLLVTEDNADAVVVIDTNQDYVLDTIPTTAPDPSYVSNASFLKGSNPNALALSPDESTLYVTNGGTNSVAVISLNTHVSPSYTYGLIPTAWYPQAITVSADGSTLFIANAKNVPGPNPMACRTMIGVNGSTDPTCNAANQYVLQLEKGGMLTVPVPADRATLDSLTAQVAQNNNFVPPANHDQNMAIMAQVRAKIQHVIYIVKENRTYDQILGDLPKGNGDPNIVVFGNAYTPNQHQIASQFVTLDNFYDSGEVSGVGWNWSTSARATDYVEKTVPTSYAGRFGPVFYEYEGTNRNVNLSVPDLASRQKLLPIPLLNDPNLLPGVRDVAAPDSSEGATGAGYLWDGALRRGLSIRNYGFYIDLTRYELPAPFTAVNIPTSATPFASGIVQAIPANAALAPYTDPYFRGFDNAWPDYYRYQEWAREFDQYVANGNLPNLSFVRFMHDHTGNFDTAQFGVDTPEVQIADNDYAVGLLLEHLAKSPYASNTLVFVIEDDAQDGPDHVDAHRSIAFVAGPYVKQAAVVSTRYNTVSFVRTIKDVLGIPYYGLTDGTAEPMADLFDITQTTWNYSSIVPGILRTSTTLPLPAATAENSLPDTRRNRVALKPRHDAKWWAKKMSGQDFDKEDDLDTDSYNHVLWLGIMGKKPYPAVRDGADLSQNREQLLKNLK
jgi:DNA-binding beta-propeller fold protein YncE